MSSNNLRIYAGPGFRCQVSVNRKQKTEDS
jgi:hypothetical protein